MNNPVWKEKDLGAVSAFGVAKENGWTGTEAEWESLQAAAPELALKSESFGAGTRNGEPLGSTDPAYQNNAKYYKNEAQKWAVGSESSGTPSATNNAQYFAGQAAGSATAAGGSATAAAGSASAAELAKTYAQTFTGAPRAAAAAADMTDHDLIYVYTGTTGGGLTNGNWYYWDGTAWAEGGTYNSTALTTDKTLSVAGAAADAAEVGKIKNIVDESLVYFTPLGVNGNPGYYDPGSNEFKSTTSTSWKYALFDVTGISYVKVSCYGGSIAKGWAFRDGEDALISNSTESANVQYTDEIVKVPTGAVQLILNAGTQGLGVIKCAVMELYDMEDYDLKDVTTLISNVFSFKSITVTQQDGYFDPKANIWNSSSSWKCAIISLPDTSKVKVSCKGGNIARGWSFLDENDGVMSYSPETTDTVYTNEIVNVPKGAAKLVLNAGTSGMAMACSYYNIDDIGSETANAGKSYIKFDGTDLYIKRKYDDTYDMCIHIYPKGPNTLPEIDKVYLVANSDSVVNDSIVESSALLTNVSDWIAPYKVRAKSNGDGDLPEGWYGHFCGGNHSYSNTSTGAPTARNTKFKVFVNGIDSSNINGFYESCDILVVNRIQGINTKKENGTGREIIEQTLTMHYTSDGTFAFEERTKALEDVILQQHYTPQVYFNGSYSVQFIGGTERSVLSGPTTANSGNMKCHEYRVFTSALTVIASVDTNSDLGDFWMSVNQSNSAFTEPYNKTYMRVINATTEDEEASVSSGKILVLDGKYRFLNTSELM